MRFCGEAFVNITGLFLLNWKLEDWWKFKLEEGYLCTWWPDKGSVVAFRQECCCLSCSLKKMALHWNTRQQTKRVKLQVKICKYKFTNQSSHITMEQTKGFLQNIAFCSWNVVSTWEQDDISENFFSRPLLMCSCKASCSMKWVLHSSKPHSPVHLNALWDGQRAGTTLNKWSINKLAVMKNPSINHQVRLKPIRASICTSITTYIYNYKVLG